MPVTGNPDGTLRPESLSQAAAEAASKQLRPLMRLQLPADPVAPSVARTQVRRWLAALAWPASQLDIILLAVNEAVSNAAEHAYRDRAPGMIELSGQVEITPSGQRGVALTVRDHGHWRPPRKDDGQGHGIPLMRACMDTVTIGPATDDRAGTQVVLRSRTVPAASR